MSYYSPSMRSRHPSRYGRQHWEKCMCEGCEKSFAEHNASKTCKCPDCEVTRQIIYVGVNQKMSAINICDRCETMVKGNALATISHTFDPTKPMETQEVCPGCAREFDQWRKMEPASARERAYSRPYVPDPEGEDPHETLDTELLAALLLKRLSGGKELPAGDAPTVVQRSVEG